VKHVRFLWRWLWIVLLAGCARLPGHLPRNASFHPIERVATPGGILRTASWPQQHWWRALQDPTLDALIQQAMAQNPTIQMAAARVLAAQGAAAVARSRLLPHFASTLSFTQQYFSAQGLHLAANGTSNFYTELDPLDMDYQVDLWGKDQDLVRAARGISQMTQAEAAQTRLLISTAVVLHDSALVGYQALLAKETALQRVQEQILTLQQGAFASGVANQGPVWQARLSLAQTVRVKAALVAACAAEEHAVAALVGQGPKALSHIGVVQGPMPIPPTTLPQDLPLGLLAQRPDIVAARWAVEAAAARVHAARAAFYPDLNLRLIAGWNSIHFGDLFDPGNFAHAVGPVLRLPIFTGGALRGQLKTDNALFLVAQDQYRSRILGALRQIADLLSTWQKLQRQQVAQEQSLVAAQKRLRLTQGACDSGIAGQLPSLMAEQQCLKIEAEGIRLQTARVQNWALLESALGGGYGSSVRKSQEP